MNNHDAKSVFLTQTPKKEPLGNEKSGYLAGLCDDQPPELPPLNLIPAGLILIAVAYNEGKHSKPGYETALVCDNEYDWNQVHEAIQKGYEDRPVHFFLIKREWVRQMANRPLRSER